MHPLAKLDHQFVWHPFTQMRDWLQREPIVIARGKGAVLWDVNDKEYLDANASIWTNIHGHCHPKINAAIRRQLGRLEHSSALGLANEPASTLAARLIHSVETGYQWNVSAKPRGGPKGKHSNSRPDVPLTKVFYSDNGSTAVEVALKLAYEYARRTGSSKKPKFLSLQGAYHGDTVGAVSVGHIDLFHKAYAGLVFQTDKVMSPYCYRCPFNRSRPERGDARDYRQCQWECVDVVERSFASQTKKGNPYAAFVLEPMIQGAAGIIPQPAGWLSRVAEITRSHHSLFVADEVMIGFGRAGFPESWMASSNPPCPAPLFAVQHEGVQPDMMAIAKGMTGGYLPMAATLTTQAIFDQFLGDYEEFKTFFHGHSYTANQLASVASLASLDLLDSPASIQSRMRLQRHIKTLARELWTLPQVGDVRQVGLVLGIELVKDWTKREPFLLAERAGMRVCDAMARRGVLSRPIGNVLLIMPPYCTTAIQLQAMFSVLQDAIAEVFHARK